MNIIKEIRKELHIVKSIRKWITILEKNMTEEGAQSVESLMYVSVIDEDVISNITMSLFKFRQFSDKYLPEQKKRAKSDIEKEKRVINELSRWIYLVQTKYLNKVGKVFPEQVILENDLNVDTLYEGKKALSSEVEYLEDYLQYYLENGV